MSLKAALLAFGAVVIALVVFATLYQYNLERRARSWVKTRGRIRSARVVARKVKAAGNEDTEIRNFAEVTYDYDTTAGTRRGRKVRLGHDVGNAEVAETIARYPVGARVFVYYDPANPAQAVLEREAPDGMYRALIIFIAGCIAFWLLAAFGSDFVVEAVANTIPAPGNVGLALLLGGFGVFAMLLAEASHREVAATAKWASTWGQIDSVEVKSFRTAATMGAATRWWRFFYPLIVYSYPVGEQHYSGSRIALGGRMLASVDLFARREAASYRAGDPVQVFYDPANPAKAVLQRRSRGLGWMWIVAAVLIGFAGRAAGFF